MPNFTNFHSFVIFAEKCGIFDVFAVSEVLTGIFGRKELFYQDHNKVPIVRLFNLLNFIKSKSFLYI